MALTTGNETIVPTQKWYGSRAQWVRILTTLSAAIGAIVQAVASYQAPAAGGPEATGHGGAAVGLAYIAYHALTGFFDREKQNKVDAAKLTVATGAPLPVEVK